MNAALARRRSRVQIPPGPPEDLFFGLLNWFFEKNLVSRLVSWCLISPFMLVECTMIHAWEADWCFSTLEPRNLLEQASDLPWTNVSKPPFKDKNRLHFSSPDINISKDTPIVLNLKYKMLRWWNKKKAMNRLLEDPYQFQFMREAKVYCREHLIDYNVF